MPSVRKTPLATFGATFLERPKLKTFRQSLKKASSGHNQAKFAFLGAVPKGPFSTKKSLALLFFTKFTTATVFTTGPFLLRFCLCGPPFGPKITTEFGGVPFSIGIDSLFFYYGLGLELLLFWLVVPRVLECPCALQVSQLHGCSSLFVSHCLSMDRCLV